MEKIDADYKQRTLKTEVFSIQSGTYTVTNESTQADL